MPKKLLLISFILIFGVVFMGNGCTSDDLVIDENLNGGDLISNTNVQKPSREMDERKDYSKYAKQVVADYFEQSYGDLSYINVSADAKDPQYYISNEPGTITNLSTCVPNKPDDMYIFNTGGGQTKIESTIKAGYGKYPNYEYEDGWKFSLEFENGEWKIKEIKCI